MSAIRLENVTVRYGRHAALNDLSLAIEPGALVAVAGPNGAGKSTLLKVLAGLLRPASGSVTVPADIAYLPQLANLQRDMPLTVMQAVCSAYWGRLGNRGAIAAILQDQARAALHEVGLHGCENRQLAALSGGQFQRLLFARLVLQDAQTILLDEPFAAVDAPTIKLLLQIIQAWHREGRTILCVLHSAILVKRHFPEVLLLDRSLAGHGPTAALAAHPLLAEDF